MSISPTPVSEFSLVGGHPVVQFVNTRPMRDGRRDERLGSFDDLVRWAAFAGLVDGGQVARLERAANGEAAQAMREMAALRAALERAFDGMEADRAVLQALVNNLMAARSGSLMLDADGAMRFQAPVERPAELIANIAQAGAEFLSADLIGRVRQCASDRCVLWFVDTSRNGSRHWCTMAGCGARAKAAAYYRRRTA